MKKFILDQNGDMTEYLHWDPETGFYGDFVIETVYDNTKLIEQNKILRDMSRPGDVMKEGAMGTLMGRVGPDIIMKADREKWTDKDWDKFFNDPDNAAFKTFYGKF